MTQALLSSMGTGRIQSGEIDAFLVPKNWQGGKGMVLAHGVGGTVDGLVTGTGYANFYAWEYAQQRLLSYIDGGQPGVTAWGTTSWGNSGWLSRMDALYTYMTGTLGCASKVFLWGISMGTTCSLAWAAANPTKVAGLILMIPALSVNDIWTNNRSGLKAGIDTAFGGSYVSSTQQGAHDGVYMASSAGGSLFAGMPMYLCYGGVDPTAVPTTVRSFIYNVTGSTPATSDPSGFTHFSSGVVTATQVDNGSHSGDPNPVGSVPTTGYANLLAETTAFIAEYQ